MIPKIVFLIGTRRRLRVCIGNIMIFLRKK